MIKIFYGQFLMLISIIWIVVRVIFAFKNKRIYIKREITLILVYICIVVVSRFTFFPFFKVNGAIQPLILNIKRIFPFRINIKPLVLLFDYPTLKEAILNIIGNVTMFIPLGIVWPSVFKKLNNHRKVLFAGFSASLLIEVLQLPFYDRVTDIDDLLMNFIGFSIGYGIFCLAKKMKKMHFKSKKIKVFSTFGKA